MNKYVNMFFDIALLSYIISRAGIELTFIIWSWIVGYYVISKMTNIIEKIISYVKGEDK